MLLQKITLENFRQFKKATLEFAEGNTTKNVTLILGENGTGKTTFAQAFFWCMYGETHFSDKVMLNKDVEKSLLPQEVAKVKVTLELIQDAKAYILSREQRFEKDYTGKVKEKNAIFNIGIKRGNGNLEFVPKNLQLDTVESILPQSLAHYFFFDGERIENMGKNIADAKKVVEFDEAVNRLIGLNGQRMAIQHLNPRSKYSVIGQLEREFDGSSDSKVRELNERIHRCEENIEKKNQTIEENKNQIANAKAMNKRYENELKTYKDAENLVKDKEALRKENDLLEDNNEELKNAVCKEFSKGMRKVFSLRMLQDALEIVSKEDIIGKDIPFIRDATIYHLLKQGVCICGTHLDEGSIPYNNLKDLIDYLPPKSISNLISDFKNEARKRLTYESNIINEIEGDLGKISSNYERIDSNIQQIEAINEQLMGKDVAARIRELSGRINDNEKLITKKTDENEVLTEELGEIKGEARSAREERKKLTLKTGKNKQIEIQLAYAQRIYSDLQKIYNESEKAVRERLQKTINEVFLQIYNGGMYVVIDEKYRVSVFVNDYEGDVETSTAQSIAVIFAFIISIIKMIRENRDEMEKNPNGVMLSSEMYPLVMDAPLSAFDKRRIKGVCEALPNAAEQIVIFIKDTDGSLAEKYMGDKIGTRYNLIKKNEFETILQ